METEKAAITKARGPRRVGLKRTSFSKSMLSPMVIDSETTGDSELTDSPAAKPFENDVPKTDDVTLRLESNNVTKSVDDPTSAEPQVEVNDNILKSNKSEDNEMEALSEDSEEFHGFQSLPSDAKAKPILSKLLGEAESELDCENNMSDSDKMDVDPENDNSDSANVVIKKERKSGTDIEENGKSGVSDDDEVKETDGSFDNMKLLSEVSSEVTSSNDVSNTNLNDSPVKANDEAASEVTSSATNSPSLSASRGNGKGPTSRKNLVNSPANTSRRSIKKTSVDLSNPAFLKPFDFGWKRELVYRNSNETSTKIMADIYYYTPAGKKIRSNREVSDHLHGVDLTTDNFTFFKEALGVEDPEKEIIRVAKRVSGVATQRSPQPKKIATPKLPKPLKEVKESPESAVTKVGGPKAAARTFPRIKITPTQLMRSSPSNKGKSKRIRSSSDDGDMEMGMLPPTWNPSTAKKGMNSLEPCSLRCLGLMGRIPSLQCRLCLCLYHPECMGLGTINDPSLLHSYVCKNCQDKKNGKTLGGSSSTVIAKSVPGPPLLTPISAMSGGVKNEKTIGGVQKSPPQLTRLPRPSDPKLYTVPRYVKLQGQEGTVLTSTSCPVRVQSQPMVGAVTTWLPPSSTIQMTSNPKSSNTTAASTTGTAALADAIPNSNVQSIATLGGKKYIVVSRHNVLSVSNPSNPLVPAAKSGAESPVENTPTSSGSNLVLTNSGQVVMSSGDNMGLVQTVESNQIQGPGGPILPKPSTYVYSGGQNQSGGVLLVPWVSSNPSTVPSQLGSKNAASGQQLYLVNGPNGNFVVSGLPGQIQMDSGSPAGETPATSLAKKRKRDSEKDPNLAKREKKTGVISEVEHNFMEFFANNLSAGYSAIKQVFQYLKVKELLRAARVCKMWRDLAGHESLWRIVRMKNSQVDDWEGLVTSLVRHGTQQLDLRKILLPNDPDDINKMWRSFLKEISRASGIVRVDLCRCPAFVVEELPLACPQLTVVNALAIKCSTISLDTLTSLANIQELRLKSMTGIHLTSSLEALKELKHLKHLSLTTFKDLGKAGPEVIISLTNLETLEIGECSDFTDEFGKEVLSKLTKLTSLRLEKGQGKTCPTFSLLAGVKELPTLNQLELVNFDVKAGFSEALAQCTNIKRLLIIPTYVTQSATTNHMVLAGVTELKDSLSHFVWGVTHELLRVTELFIDQCDTKEGGGQGKVAKVAKSPDSIPILKPDASSKIDDWEGVACKSMSSPVGQVEILTLTKLQQVLTKSLPNTKIKILKVAFQSTWRQSISEPTP